MGRFSKRRTRDAAPALLHAAQAAYGWIVAENSHHRDQILVVLREAIALAEDPSAIGKMSFITTPRTGEQIMDYVHLNNDKSSEHQHLIEELQEGMRTTKQRTYFQLDADPTLLRRLRFALHGSFPPKSRRALIRVVEQIDKILAKHPLVALAEIA